MPNFAGKGTKKRDKTKVKENKKKTPKTPKKSKKSKDDEQDEAVVIGVTDPDEVDEEDDVQEESSSKSKSSVKSTTIVKPFSDGLVASSLSDMIVVPRVGGEEVEILKEFLVYFASTGTFIGTVSNKLSFMKKKGGLLL